MTDVRSTTAVHALRKRPVPTLRPSGVPPFMRRNWASKNRWCRGCSTLTGVTDARHAAHTSVGPTRSPHPCPFPPKIEASRIRSRTTKWSNADRPSEKLFPAASKAAPPLSTSPPNAPMPPPQPTARARAARSCRLAGRPHTHGAGFGSAAGIFWPAHFPPSASHALAAGSNTRKLS